jgi:hypothetical protein
MKPTTTLHDGDYHLAYLYSKQRRHLLTASA